LVVRLLLQLLQLLSFQYAFWHAIACVCGLVFRRWTLVAAVLISGSIELQDDVILNVISKPIFRKSMAALFGWTVIPDIYITQQNIV